MSLKKGKRSAYRSRRSPQLTPGLPQATLVEGRDEDLHGVDSVHFPTAYNFISNQRRRSSGTRQRIEGIIGFDMGIYTNCRLSVRPLAHWLQSPDEGFHSRLTRLLDNRPDNNIRALTLSMPLRHNGRASALQRATFSIIASSNVLQSRSGTLATDGVSGAP